MTSLLVKITYTVAEVTFKVAVVTSSVAKITFVVTEITFTMADISLLVAIISPLWWARVGVNSILSIPNSNPIPFYQFPSQFQLLWF